jgi:hypothetical protein
VELEEVEWSQAGMYNELRQFEAATNNLTVRRQDLEVAHDAADRHGFSIRQGLQAIRRQIRKG